MERNSQAEVLKTERALNLTVLFTILLRDDYSSRFLCDSLLERAEVWISRLNRLRSFQCG